MCKTVCGLQLYQDRQWSPIKDFHPKPLLRVLVIGVAAPVLVWTMKHATEKNIKQCQLTKTGAGYIINDATKRRSTDAASTPKRSWQPSQAWWWWWGGGRTWTTLNKVMTDTWMTLSHCTGSQSSTGREQENKTAQQLQQQ